MRFQDLDADVLVKSKRNHEEYRPDGNELKFHTTHKLERKRTMKIRKTITKRRTGAGGA